MSSWAEATYVINKLNTSLTIALNLDNDLQKIENANEDISNLKVASSNYNTRIGQAEDNITTLLEEVDDFKAFINQSKEEDFSTLGPQIEELKTSLQTAEHQIAFIDRKQNNSNIPAEIVTTPTDSIWLILED